MNIKSLLRFLEDVGGTHSNKVGYGLLDIPIKHKSWILINWKVKILKRPKYSETLKVVTWSPGMDRIHADRDFEVFNEAGERVIIASSKWVCFDTDKMSIVRIDKDLENAYTTETKRVFDEPIKKLQEPTSEPINSVIITATKDMIDVNRHVHNINYIDFSAHVLPFEVMQNATDIEIMYKKEIKEDDKIKCSYFIQDGFHYVVIKDETELNLHAIIKLK